MNAINANKIRTLLFGLFSVFVTTKRDNKINNVVINNLIVEPNCNSLENAQKIFKGIKKKINFKFTLIYLAPDISIRSSPVLSLCK